MIVTVPSDIAGVMTMETVVSSLAASSKPSPASETRTVSSTVRESCGNSMSG